MGSSGSISRLIGLGVESSMDPMADSLTYNSSVDWMEGEEELRYPELLSQESVELLL